MNPFVLSRLELDSPRTLEQVGAALERLLRDGFDRGDRHYRLFGSRRGRYFSMSLGMPLLGGAAPVLRARLRDEAAPRFDVSVGARVELVVFGGFWLVLTVFGSGYQLFLQLQAVVAGRATLADAVAVLPGIAVMVAILGFAFWYFRARATRDALVLLDVFREAIGAAPPSAGSSLRLRASS